MRPASDEELVFNSPVSSGMDLRRFILRSEVLKLYREGLRTIRGADPSLRGEGSRAATRARADSRAKLLSERAEREAD